MKKSHFFQKKKKKKRESSFNFFKEIKKTLKDFKILTKKILKILEKIDKGFYYHFKMVLAIKIDANSRLTDDLKLNFTNF